MNSENISFLLDIADKNNIVFILEELKTDLSNLALKEKTTSDKIVSIGLMNEKIFKRIYQNKFGEDSETRYKNIGEILYKLSQLAKNDKFYFPKEIEQMSRMISFYRNLCAHENNSDFESEILKCNDLTLSDENVIGRFLYKIIIYFIKLEEIAGIIYPHYQETNRINENYVISNFTKEIPDLDLQFDKYPKIIINEHTDIFDIKIIIDYLIKSKPFELIENTYFDKSYKGQLVHKILRSRYGITRSWQTLFKNEDPKIIYTKLNDEKHKILKLAIKSYYRKL